MTFGQVTRRQTFQGERALMGYVFLTALQDLRDEIECTHDGEDEPRVGCDHRFRTARRFLLGTKPEWREWRDILCELVGQLPEQIEKQAIDVLHKRKRVA